MPHQIRPKAAAISSPKPAISRSSTVVDAAVFGAVKSAADATKTANMRETGFLNISIREVLFEYMLRFRLRWGDGVQSGLGPEVEESEKTTNIQRPTLNFQCWPLKTED